MSYVTFAEYQELYPNGASSQQFTTLSWEADRLLDKYTTGIDNVRKLQVAMPTEEYDLGAVKHCACALVNLLYQLSTLEEAAFSAAGFVSKADGTVVGKQISSISSGSESISYSSGLGASGSSIGNAVSDPTVREQLFDRTVKHYLSGIPDANGVNLLYMGVYPVVL